MNEVTRPPSADRIAGGVGGSNAERPTLLKGDRVLVLNQHQAMFCMSTPWRGRENDQKLESPKKCRPFNFNFFGQLQPVNFDLMLGSL